MEVRCPKVSTVFLGDGFCGSVLCSAAKARGKHAAIVDFSSESYRWLLLSVENCGSCGGAHVVAVAVAEEPPRKSSNLGPPVNMERLVGPAPAVGSGGASTVLLPERYKIK